MAKYKILYTSFALMVACSFLENLEILLLILVLVLGMVLMKGLNVKRIIKRALVMFLLTGALITLMSIVRNGWIYGWMLTLRLMNSLLLGFSLLEAYTEYEILDALRLVRVPRLLLEVMAFIIRYFGVILRESRKMWIARQSRSFDSGDWIKASTLREIGNMIGILFIKSYNRSLRIERSIVARRGDL